MPALYTRTCHAILDGGWEGGCWSWMDLLSFGQLEGLGLEGGKSPNHSKILNDLDLLKEAISIHFARFKKKYEARNAIRRKRENKNNISGAS
jgi:hypothetical protein